MHVFLHDIELSRHAPSNGVHGEEHFLALAGK